MTKTNEYKANNYKVTKNSSWCLIVSLFWAAIGFVLTFALSCLYSYLVIKFGSNILFSNAYTISSAIIAIVFIFLLIFFKYKWNTDIINASFGTIFINLLLNVILFSGIIAPFVTLLNNPYLIYSIIGVTGLIFLLIGLVGYFLINKYSAIAIRKIMNYVILAMFIMEMIFIFPFAFLFTNMFSIYYLIYDIAFAVITIGLVALTFWKISRISNLYNQITKIQALKVSLYFGLELLNCFILVFLLVIRLFARNE